MKIKVTTERECCQEADLKPCGGSPRFAPGGAYQYMFCSYCGQLWEQYRENVGGYPGDALKRVQMPWMPPK